MLVVQEQTGPAAAWQLWKMPTGLLDDAEDVHHAAVRELREETGLEAHWDGMLAVRQAHSTSSSSSKTAQPAVGRKHSDLFFVCQMSLVRANHDQTNCENGDIEATTTTTTITTLLNEDNNRSYWDNDPWTICPTEIAAIRWMTVREYAAQARWQQSPVYLELNQAILDAAGCDDNNTPTAAAALWKGYTLPLRLDGGDGATNALYKSSSVNKIKNNNNDNHDDVDS